VFSLLTYLHQPHNIARLATVGWIGLLIYLAQLAQLPQLPDVPVASDGTASRVAHFGTHLMLVVFVYLAIPFPKTRWQRARVVGFAFTVSVILGIGLESLQSFLPSRAFVYLDFFLDAAGAAAGVALAISIDRLKLNRRWLSVAALGVTLALTAVTAATVAFPALLHRVFQLF